MTKSEILALIRTTHADLLSLLAQTPDAQAAQPGAEGEWSVKDIVAHILYWEQTVADELKLFASSQTPRTIPHSEIQNLNDRNTAYHRPRPFAEVKIDLHNSMAAHIAAVQALTEDQLQSPCTWVDIEKVGDNSVDEMGHWRMHIAAIQKWLADQTLAI